MKNTLEPSEEELTLLRNQKATWQLDGLGIKGQVEIISDTKAKLSWEEKPTLRRPVVDHIT